MASVESFDFLSNNSKKIQQRHQHGERRLVAFVWLARNIQGSPKIARISFILEQCDPTHQLLCNAVYTQDSVTLLLQNTQRQKLKWKVA